jgi:hypothetical protein
MEISKEQLLQIDKYIYACGIRFYDVRIEIVDHFANILEQKLTKNPELDFKQEIINIHKNFSDNGFKKLIKKKTNAVQKQFYKHSLKHLVTFFKLPKIILSGALFYVLYLLMHVFENKDYFFLWAHGFTLLLVANIAYQNWKNKGKEGETFLVLNKADHFIQIVNLVFISFNTITNFRNNQSFLNPTHNNIHLFVFVVLLLFYCSGEAVFSQNEKLVQKQYPNILVS